MKEEFDKKAKEINSHTSSEADRIIKEITPMVTFFSGCDSTNPQDRVNARILQNAANNKANKEDRVLIREQKEKAKAEAKGKAKAKAKKPAASSATASTAAPSEQLESEGEPMKNQSSDSDESSDEEEPMPPAKATAAKPAPQKSVSKDANQDEESSDAYRRKRKRPINALTSQETKKVAREINPNANVVWSKTCDDKEKEHLRKPISDVTALLKDCKTSHDIKNTFDRPLSMLSSDWPKCYELNWKDELAVYIHRKSHIYCQLGELLCKVSRKL